MSQRDYNNNVGQFVQKCKNSMFVIFIRLVKIQKLFNLLLSTQYAKCCRGKKKTSDIKIYMQNMNITVGLDVAKWNLFSMKPNNITSLRRMSRVRLAWRGFMAVNWPFCSRSWSIHTLLHPYSALSLMNGALGKTLPCRPHFTQIWF